jgi:hypothetical protein
VRSIGILALSPKQKKGLVVVVSVAIFEKFLSSLQHPQARMESNKDTNKNRIKKVTEIEDTSISPPKPV